MGVCVVCWGRVRARGEADLIRYLLDTPARDRWDRYCSHRPGRGYFITFSDVAARGFAIHIIHVHMHTCAGNTKKRNLNTQEDLVKVNRDLTTSSGTAPAGSPKPLARTAISTASIRVAGCEGLPGSHLYLVWTR